MVFNDKFHGHLVHPVCFNLKAARRASEIPPALQRRFNATRQSNIVGQLTISTRKPYGQSFIHLMGERIHVLDRLKGALLVRELLLVLDAHRGAPEEPELVCRISPEVQDHPLRSNLLERDVRDVLGYAIGCYLEALRDVAPSDRD